jgi:hypothetical protein
MYDIFPKFDPCQACGHLIPNEFEARCPLCYWRQDGDLENDDPRERLGVDVFANDTLNGYISLRYAQLFVRTYGSFQLQAIREDPDEADRYERLRLPRDPDWRPLPPPYTGRPVHDPDLPIRDAPCPCCGHRTIACGFDICAVCGWVYCPDQERPYSHDHLKTNFMTLHDGQQSYLSVGAVCDEMVRFVRPPAAAEPRDPAWGPLPPPELGDPGPAPEHGALSRLTCPVCGYKALRLPRNAWRSSVCAICGWHYYLGHLDLRDWSRPNPITLREAQANFRRLGTWCEDPALRRGVETRAPTRDDIRDPAWTPLG